MIQHAPNMGTMASIGNSLFIVGHLDFLRRLHVELHQGECEAADELERRGNYVYAVVAERDGHCLGHIAISPIRSPAVAAGVDRVDRAADGIDGDASVQRPDTAGADRRRSYSHCIEYG